jgi:hypothetical protein
VSFISVLSSCLRDVAAIWPARRCTAKLTARDKNARNLEHILLPKPVSSHLTVSPSAIPTSANVIGPAISPPMETLTEVLTGAAAFDPAAICSANSAQSVSPAPLNHPPHPQTFGGIPGLTGTAGMADMLKSARASDPGQV